MPAKVISLDLNKHNLKNKSTQDKIITNNLLLLLKQL